MDCKKCKYHSIDNGKNKCLDQITWLNENHESVCGYRDDVKYIECPECGHENIYNDIEQLDTGDYKCISCGDEF